MPRPFVCPRCNGEKKIHEGSIQRVCPTCEGKGVVWKNNSDGSDGPKAGDDLKK